MTMNATTETARKILLNALMETSPRPGKELDALVKAGGCSQGQLSGACRDLKLRGLIYQPGRGTYAITEAGRAVAEGGPLPAIPKDAEVSDDGASTMARSEEEATPGTVDSEPAPVAEPAAPAKRRLKVANAPATPVEVPSWLDDADVRALAVEATECFGAWSAKSGECGRCPLAGWCRNAKAATLALLATKLSTETPAAPAPVTPSVAKLDEAVSVANAPTAPRTAPDAGMTLKARVDGICAASGRPIKAGDVIRYLPGFGLYHADETPPADVTVTK